MLNKTFGLLIIFYLLINLYVFADNKSVVELISEADIVCVGEIGNAEDWISAIGSPHKGVPLFTCCIPKCGLLISRKHADKFLYNIIPLDPGNYKQKFGVFFLRFDKNDELFKILELQDYSENNLLKIFNYKKDNNFAFTFSQDENSLKIDSDNKLIYHLVNDTVFAYIANKEKRGIIITLPSVPSKYIPSENLIYFYGGVHRYNLFISVYKFHKGELSEIFYTETAYKDFNNIVDMDNDGIYEIITYSRLMDQGMILLPKVYQYCDGDFIDVSLNFKEIYSEFIYAAPNNEPEKYRLYKIRRMFGINDKAGLENAFEWLKNEDDQIKRLGILTLYEIENEKAKKAVELFKQEFPEKFKYYIEKINELPKNRENQ